MTIDAVEENLPMSMRRIVRISGTREAVRMRVVRVAA